MTNEDGARASDRLRREMAELARRQEELERRVRMVERRLEVVRSGRDAAGERDEG